MLDRKKIPVSEENIHTPQYSKTPVERLSYNFFLFYPIYISKIRCNSQKRFTDSEKATENTPITRKKCLFLDVPSPAK